MRPFISTILTGAALACTTAAPASPKPCRGRDGKIIACPKPQPKPAPNRCKDNKGRFACKAPAPGTAPATS